MGDKNLVEYTKYIEYNRFVDYIKKETLYEYSKASEKDIKTGQKNRENLENNWSSFGTDRVWF